MSSGIRIPGARSPFAARIVQPKDISGAESDRFIERIETFSGCDEARDWALSLHVDLPLWRTGELHWEEMSTVRPLALQLATDSDVQHLDRDLARAFPSRRCR